MSQDLRDKLAHHRYHGDLRWADGEENRSEGQGTTGKAQSWCGPVCEDTGAAGVGQCVRTQEQEIVGGGSTQLGWAACRATEIPD